MTVNVIYSEYNKDTMVRNQKFKIIKRGFRISKECINKKKVQLNIPR